MPPAPQAPVPQIPVPQAAIPEPRVGFALYRLGDRVKAFDLAHVEWLDLIETLIADDHGGGIVVPALEEAVDLAPHDEVAARNPSGPWPLIVLGKDGRRIGLIVDEVIDVVESLDPEIEIVEPDSVFAAGTD
ncbi:MAG: hypothetical protein HN403_18570 [Rhodospirillales bacterium]|nr:hypothetical protein [Rhodospirillales bacterium]